MAQPASQILALVKCELRVVQWSLVGSILSNLCELRIYLFAILPFDLLGNVVTDLEPRLIYSVGKSFFSASPVPQHRLSRLDTYA